MKIFIMYIESLESVSVTSNTRVHTVLELDVWRCCILKKEGTVHPNVIMHGERERKRTNE